MYVGLTMSDFRATSDSHVSGSRTLPRHVFTSADVLANERDRIFARAWNCVGRTSAIAAPGDFVLADIAGESIIVLRDGDTVRAFFNVCRHRGTRLCEDSRGSFDGRIQCPYHGWTYGTDGSLLGAPHMQGVEGFERDGFGLHEAALAEWEGFLFVNPARDAQPFENSWTPMIGRLSRFGLSDLVIGHSVTYDVHANWKLVFQNYSECLHCPTIHPELSTVLPFQSGANDLTEGPFLGGYMELKPPNASATLTGKPAGRVVSDELSDDDRHRAFYYSLMPNMLLSVHPDYVNYYVLRPIAPDRTIVESEWLFHPETLTADSNIQDAIDFWDVTNRQDWDIVRRSQLGISSRRYEPGPYSARESLPAAWDREYLRWMAADPTPE